MKVTDIRDDCFLEQQKYYSEQDAQMLLSYQNDFVDVGCPACCHKNSQIEFQKNGFLYMECSHCHMLYMNPRPTPNILQKFYKESLNYKFFNDSIFPASEDTRRLKLFIPRLNKIIDIIKKYDLPHENLFEVGAGYGIFCEEAVKSKFFRTVSAIEASEVLAITCQQRGFTCYNSTIEEFKSSLLFDVIVNFEVLEHIFSPYDFLNKMNMLSIDGGILLMTFPGWDGFETTVLREFSTTVDAEHQNYFTKEAITMLLERCGYNIISFETPGQLDVDLVRRAIKSGLKVDPFIEKLCRDGSGENFQTFLMENKLSSHIMVCAKKIGVNK